LYTISALYLKVSGLGVRECSRIFAGVAQVSPALVAVTAGGDGRQAGLSGWQVSEAVLGAIGGQAGQAGWSSRQVRWSGQVVRWVEGQAGLGQVVRWVEGQAGLGQVGQGHGGQG